MNDDIGLLSAEAHAIVREEEALLSRALASLGGARARARRGGTCDGLRSTEGLRALREEASTAAEDDLPALLLEMSVRQKLRERPAEAPLPDPLSPYLAHLRISEGQAKRDYLLGHASFVDPDTGVRIVDWRVAPVAKIFYRYREGDEFDEVFPGREVEGVVEARRIVVVMGGVLTRILADGVALSRGPDGAWMSEDARALSPGGAGTATRPGILGVGAGRAGRSNAAEVTALLDAEQFAAVSAPAEQPLLVLGSAGSGKTTVALHRLAALTAREPQRFPISGVKVVVPEPGLARLSTRLLEPLGGGAAEVQTLDAWSLDLARRVLGDKLPTIGEDTPALVSSVKRHPALYRALKARFARTKPADLTVKRVLRKLAVLYTDRPFLEGVVAASGGTLPRSAVEETVRHTMLQLAEPVKRLLDTITAPEMKQAVDGRPIEEGTPDELAGTIDVEDLPILLSIKAWSSRIDAPRVAHLVLDEAEDFSLFDLHVLGKLLGETRAVTLAGDEAQQTSSSFAGWEESVATLGVRDAVTCRLSVSYRCPLPVVELARTILGSLAPEGPPRAARDGAPIGRFGFPEQEQADLFIAGAVRDLVEREPLASIAVIVRDADAARRFFELVSEVPGSRLVLQGEFTFEPGLDVTDVDNAKGLEFDYVIVPDASAEAYPRTDDARRRLHVAVTRASHQLWLAWSGAPSPLIG